MNAQVKTLPALNPLSLAIIVEILEVKVEKIAGQKKDGGEYSFRKQEAYLHTGHGYPDRFEFILGRDEEGRDEPARRPGFYAIKGTSLKVEKGRLMFGFDFQLEAIPGVNSPAELAAALKA
jgi:hypothetical protein